MYNKCEWLEDIKKEEGSLVSFMACVEEGIKEKKEFEKGLDSKVKLAMYRTFGKNIEYKIICMELVMLGQDLCLNLDQERMF